MVRFGRVLFAFVCLIIAAGLVLPLYPQDVATSTVAAATDSVQLAADTQTSSCQDCPVAGSGADCQPDCACGEVLPATFVSPEASFSLTISLIVGPEPSKQPREPQPLPPKLPAI